MKRSLRIVVSVACLAACVLVPELRGRSRRWRDGLYGQMTPTRTRVAASNDGQMRFWTIPSANLAGFAVYGTFHQPKMGCFDRFDSAIFANSSLRRFMCRTSD